VYERIRWNYNILYLYLLENAVVERLRFFKPNLLQLVLWIKKKLQLYTRKWWWSLISDYYRNNSGFTGVNFFKRFNFNTNSNFINLKFSLPQNCSSITRVSYLNSVKNNTKFQFYWNLSVIGFFVWWHIAIGNSYIIILLFAAIIGLSNRYP